MASRSGRDGRLKGFRLAEIDIKIRRQVARRVPGALRADARPEVKLMGALRDFAAFGDDAVLAAAEHPSERVYWIPRDAWERVMGP